MIVGSHSLSWVKAVASYSWFVKRMYQSRGSQGLAIFLKAANLMLIRSVAGRKLENSRLAGGAVSSTSGGLPRVIIPAHRKRIRGGDKSVIRFWLGLFTLYRVLSFRGRLNLNTITDPGVELSDDLLYDWKIFLKVFWSNLKKFGVSPLESRLTDVDLLSPGIRMKREKTYWFFPSLEGTRRVITSSGPGSYKTAGNSVISHGYDAMLWVMASSLYPYLKAMCLFTGNIHFIDSAPFKLGEIHAKAVWNRNVIGETELGRLSIKEEPGKLRIFAMVDSVTQWVLYPLHKALFSVLRLIPQDGTFDQLAPVKKLIGTMREQGREHLWSFDLSAATDRIPVVLQELTLAGFTSPTFASVWRSLLCDRWYRVPDLFVKTFGQKGVKSLGCGPWPQLSAKGTEIETWIGAVRYAVGQPMGAYSSWAMLALVHHAIVQFAAWKAGHRGWFSLYAVLGDDIVIGDNNVADRYVRLMKEFGVGIGFHKSIISNNLSLEFAKRFFYKGEEVTPLPLVGISVGWLGASFVSEIVKISQAVTGCVLSNFNVARYLGVGFKAASGADNRPFLKLPKILSRVLILLARPNAARSVGNLLDWVSAISFKKSMTLDQKGRDAFVRHLVTWAQDYRFPKLLELLETNMKKFIPSKTFESSEAVFKEYAQWFEWYIREPLIQDFELKRMEVEASLRKVQSIVLPSENDVVHLLEDLEEFEALISEIPGQVFPHKSWKHEKSEVIRAERASAKLAREGPANVKRWRSLRRFFIDPASK